MDINQSIGSTFVGALNRYLRFSAVEYDGVDFTFRIDDYRLNVLFLQSKRHVSMHEVFIRTCSPVRFILYW